MIFFSVLISIILLVILIVWAKINPFLAFLLSSLLAGFLLGIPLPEIAGSVQKGIGDLLGSLVVVITLGAMLGKIVAESGAAQRIAEFLMSLFGKKNILWAVSLTAFIVGIPLFFNVGFVLLVPLIFTVSYQFRLPAMYLGIPMLAALSVTHGLLPPHPAPVALVSQFGANMGITLIYGLILSIPLIIIAGPFFARFVKNIKAEPLETFMAAPMLKKDLPGIFNSFFSALLPVFLLILSSLLIYTADNGSAILPYLVFISDPGVVMLLSLLTATLTLGWQMGKKTKIIMGYYEVAVKDIAMILLIIAGAGALKQVLMDSGVSLTIANSLQNWNVHPLILAWSIAAVIRICVGSATVAALTTAGMTVPLVSSGMVNPNLMVLSIGAGSLIFSHFNDGGFWLVKEYFNLTIKETLLSWSLMETIVAVLGLVGVLILDLFLS